MSQQSAQIIPLARATSAIKDRGLSEAQMRAKLLRDYEAAQKGGLK